MNRTLLPVALGTFSLACAASNLPEQQLIDTEAAINAATEIDTGAENPEVSLHIMYARDQVKAAKELLDDGDEKRAEVMLERAQADAELALACARTARSRSEAKDAWHEVEELRNESRDQ
jgi:hypothetical protein